jgi:Phosphate-selective porin O and P
MNRIGLPLGLAALLVSFSASAVRVPTGSDDINLNVNAFMQARYEGTFEGSVEKSLDSDFFLRRARIQVSGTAYKTLSFLIQTDNSNMGKRGSPTSVAGASNPAFVQDLVIGWTPIEDFTVEMGLLLTPTSRILGYSASGGQVQIEAPIDVIFQNLDRGFRQNGVEVRGFLVGRRIHYRAGVWEGFHSTPAAGTNPPINPGGKPMVGAHVRLNLIGEETGYAFNAMYLDGKPRASIGGSVQYQPRAACPAAVTGCSIASGTGATATINDYKFFGGDAFIDWPLPGDMEFSADGGIFRWDYGSNALAAGATTTGFPRTGTAFAGSLNFRVGVIGAFASAYKYGSDSGFPHTSDRRKIAGGLTWFIKGQADKITLEVNNITPGAPGVPSSTAPVADPNGLKGPATTAIWLQGQAGF